MAEVTVTASAVQATSTTIVKDGTFGETVTAGQWCYIDTADNNEFKLAQNDGTAIQATVAGIAMNGGAAGQPGRLAIAGSVTMDGLTAKKFYFLASTAGAIELESDLMSTEKISKVGYATSATNLVIGIENTGLAAT